VTGMSPQIVTETLYALAVRSEPPFVPTEVHLISTTDGLEHARLALLPETRGHFHRLRADYSLPAIRFDEDCLHVIRDSHGQALADIRTPEDNAAAADTICTVMAALTGDDDAALHVSIAGGRKTMGYYLGYALSLFGREQDRLSHVLVSPEFEGLPDFFYPPPRQTAIYNRTQDRPLDASRATVHLAQIPFVRLRDHLPRRLLELPRFAEAVQAASSAHAPARLEIFPTRRVIVCNGTEVRLSPQSFAYYVWLAERCHLEVDDGGLVRLTEFNSRSSTLRQGLVELGQRLYPNPYEEGYDQWAQWKPDEFGGATNDWPSQRFHDVNRRLASALGPAAATTFMIQSVSVGGNRKGHRLALAPGQIAIHEFP